MDKQKLQIIVLGGLFIVAFFIWLWPQKKPAIVPAESDTLLAQTLSRISFVQTMPEDNVQSQHQDWGRNPFLLGAQPVEMVLQGIIWDPVTPQALINDQIVGVGDWVQKMQVIDIQNQKVILSDGTKTIELGVE